ncbi:MAG: acyl-CoA thioesterase [Phycisphaerales bacterium]
MKPTSTTPAIKVVMMPQDTNPQGTVFGGVILSLIDQAAWIEALRQAPLRYVTVAFEKIEFHRPVEVGDVTSLWADTMRIGRTSIRVRVLVKAYRPRLNTEIDVTSGEVVMVAVGEDGSPMQIVGS